MPTFHRHSWQGPRQTQSTKAADVLRQPLSFAGQIAQNDPYDIRTRQNREHTVCFTGHRALNHQDENLVRQLWPLLEELYRRGYRDFLCGGALGFDTVAAEYVVQLRNKRDSPAASQKPNSTRNGRGQGIRPLTAQAFHRVHQD